MKRLSLKKPKPNIEECEKFVDFIFNKLKSKITKDFRLDVFYSTRKIKNKIYEYTFSLYKTEKNSVEYELIKREFSDTLQENEVIELK